MRIVLISLDTLCVSHLSCYGYHQPTTPRIDAWADRAVRFERCYASDVPTPPSYTAMLTGRFGIHNGIFGFQDPATFRPGPPMVQEQLASAGYQTCAVSNLIYPCPWLLRGWETITPPGLRFQGGRAPDVTDAAISWLDSHAEADDAFLFVHYWEPHQPYNKAPEEHARLFSPGEYADTAPDGRLLRSNPIMKAFYEEYHRRGEGAPHLTPADVLSRYDAQVHFVDEEVGRLLAWLDQRELSADTAVFLTSDHGEAFGEYGSFDHFTCYENIAHVPLLVHLPDVESGTRDGFVYGADLAPTILRLAGLDVPDGLDGRSLLPCLQEGAREPHDVAVTDCNALVAQRMLVHDHWGLVHTLNRGPFDHIAPFELFDLHGDAERNLADAQPDKTRELRRKMEAWLEEKLQGGPDPLQEAALGGGWTYSHPSFLHGVFQHLDRARADPLLWQTLCRTNGGAPNLVARHREAIAEGLAGH
jgi:arylsulfatase A-like enzyme